MKVFKLCSMTFAIIFLLIILAFAEAQSQDSQQQKQTPAVIRRSTGVLQKSARYRVEPEYPQEAKAQGISGEVVVEVKVDESGKVISTTPVSGHQLLVEAVTRALKDWKFTPTQLSGVVVQVIGNVVFTFAKDGSVTDGSPTYPVDRNPIGQIVQSVSVETALPIISEKEAKELYQQIQTGYDIPLRISNPDNIALEIVMGVVRAAKRDEQNYALDMMDSEYVSDYVMEAAIILHNRMNKTIKGVGLKFINVETQQIFFVYSRTLEIKPQDRGRVQINFMAIAGNPANLRVEIIGFHFSDGKTVGAFPAKTNLVMQTTLPKNVIVDTKPRPLNRLRPNYTEQARSNGVSGVVRLHIQVGVDGNVKKVQVINALPAGLTEEAIRVAKILQFQPAMVGGSAVAYTVPLEVEFFSH